MNSKFVDLALIVGTIIFCGGKNVRSAELARTKLPEWPSRIGIEVFNLAVVLKNPGRSSVGILATSGLST